MLAVTENNAMKNLHKLVESVNSSPEAVIIVNDEGRNAVMVSEEEWRGLKETLYLYSIPGMRERLLEANKAPLSEYVDFDPNEDW